MTEQDKSLSEILGIEIEPWTINGTLYIANHEGQESTICPGGVLTPNSPICIDVMLKKLAEDGWKVTFWGGVQVLKRHAIGFEDHCSKKPFNQGGLWEVYKKIYGENNE